MKKALAIGIATAFITISLAGCGSNSSNASSSGAYKDGTYKAEQAAFDEHGYKGQIEITVKDGKITDVLYNEVDKNGKFKRDDADYASKMKAKNNITPKEVDEKLQQELIDSQDTSKVDTVAGATESSKTFKELADEALKDAKK
ncbi:MULTISPECIES: FMN-binding protein [Thermoanaerobacterium]|jgi:major membrane immunogen (membrane-anchored lipoprotein)|uniref:Major membrane immunogen (Membrane-anchored lipoprotein) n=1 Tax=Thermoanaerobacterium butyriciformans TaxID=1702242 RepID=A0ABS4NG71_9THEO|nr:FMN-binding protein [Thermoanaerobacterium butyriciformans]MBP2072124.1 major membrane immunogen (membrane-anchored lipoprotein) [Thermoanaerobacterium butyriciformans]WHE07210.1 FMN-binding protein [Thermoanaerobacterium thermosaccharolyticum]